MTEENNMISLEELVFFYRNHALLQKAEYRNDKTIYEERNSSSKSK